MKHISKTLQDAYDEREAALEALGSLKSESVKVFLIKYLLELKIKIDRLEEGAQ